MPFENTTLSAPVTAAAHGLRSIVFGKLTDTAAPLLSFVQSALPGAPGGGVSGGGMLPSSAGLAAAVPGAAGSGMPGMGSLSQLGAGAMAGLVGGSSPGAGLGVGLPGLASRVAQLGSGSGGMPGIGSLSQLAAGSLPSTPSFMDVPTARAAERLNAAAGLSAGGFLSNSGAALADAVAGREAGPRAGSADLANTAVSQAAVLLARGGTG